MVCTLMLEIVLAPGDYVKLQMQRTMSSNDPKNILVCTLILEVALTMWICANLQI